MTSSHPQPKNPQPTNTVIDLENGDRIAHGDSSLSNQGPASESTTPEARRSQDGSIGRPFFGSRLAAVHERVRDRIPPAVARRWHTAGAWIRGPEPPRIYRIDPWFEKVQKFPSRLVARLPRAGRLCLFATAFILWIVLFGVIITDFSLPSDVGGFGAPVRLSCITRLWPDSPSCGLDGANCLPFDDSSFAFSCPANCAGVSVLNPRTIGDETIIYRPLVVGGTPEASEGDQLVYRGDSFICGAAIHAGILQNGRGGCGVLTLTGEKSSYGSVQRNGISSVGFNSSFPLSFDFSTDENVASSALQCRDPRWNLLALSTVFTALFALFAWTPAAFFGPVFTIIYFQIAMASDPPPYNDYPSLASVALGKFLPAAFIAALLYRFVVQKTLNKLTAHIEKTILWLGACWVGALSNITLDMIPIQRLTPHDLNQQPGAITALVFIVLAIVAIAIYQAWCFRNEGRLPRYLGLYAILGLGLLILLAVPRLNLRIHHYILALLLLPGTSLQTRPSLIYQGLLIGLFINGVGRWGFAPILETAAALRGDAQLGRGIPDVFPPTINGTEIMFAWGELVRGYEGVSVLVNDVERFRGFRRDGDNNFTWERRDLDHPEFFRFGFVSYAPFASTVYSDFTRAGTWLPNGTWIDIPPGLS